MDEQERLALAIRQAGTDIARGIRMMEDMVKAWVQSPAYRRMLEEQRRRLRQRGR